jgi:hypothetical protein
MAFNIPDRWCAWLNIATRPGEKPDGEPELRVPRGQLKAEAYY